MLSRQDLYHLLKEQVDIKKEELAIINDQEQVSYKEFLESVDRLTAVILSHQIRNQGIVIALPRNSLLLATMFAVVRSGNYYIPIDLLYPMGRINYILDYGKAAFVITDQIHKDDFSQKNVILVDDLPTEEIELPEAAKEEDTIAYCLYTSGSTGNPKGVLIEEKSLINFIYGMKDAIDFTDTSSILCLTTQCFDIFFLESIYALCTGMRVVLCNDIATKNPKTILRMIQEYDVDVMQITPSRMQILLEYDHELNALQNVKLLLVGGEAFPEQLLHVLQEKVKSRIYNMYGPTETTIWSMTTELTKADKVTIGKPIRNTKIYIVNEELMPLEDQATGEIAIGGEGLSKGYLNNPEMTKERFLSLADGTRIYLTGDYGKKLEGTEEYVYSGRKDNQIKFNGYRIEPEEIEMVASRLPKLKQNVVVLEKKDTKSPKLVQYYVADQEVDEQEIIAFLKQYLPAYMIPTRFVRVKEFSYTLNGKIDRKKLPIHQPVEEFHEVQPVEAKEQGDTFFNAIKEIIYQVSGQMVTDENQDTILGGMSSFDYITVLVALEDYFDVELGDEYLENEETVSVSQLCDQLRVLVADNE